MALVSDSCDSLLFEKLNVMVVLSMIGSIRALLEDRRSLLLVA